MVADGPQTHKLVPISAFLRRSPHLSAIQTAVAETVNTASSLASITPKGNRVIRTEPVRMTDGTVHGVHVWVGPATAEPPQRPLPGPLVWNLTTGIATDTPESMRNSGLDPNSGLAANRAFTDDLAARNMSDRESQVLARAAEAEPGTTYCATWQLDDWRGSRSPWGSSPGWFWNRSVGTRARDRAGDELAQRRRVSPLNPQRGRTRRS